MKKRIRKSMIMFMFVFFIVGVIISAKSMEVSAVTSIDGLYEYTVVSDGTISITKYYGEETNLVIPSEIDGYNVTKIDESVFQLCQSLVVVDIPDSVIVILDSAFFGCDNLVEVNIPSSVTYIGDQVFSSCDNLTILNIDENNSSFSSIDGVLFNEDQTIIICFPGNTSITEYIIPDTVTTIDSYAFSSNYSLTSVQIPDSVTSIWPSAFSSAYGLTSIQIPDSVSTIPKYAFKNCRSLETVILPVSVTSILSLAFYNCSSINTVIYSGTEQQWNEISISDNANWYLTGADIFYNYIDCFDILTSVTANYESTTGITAITPAVTYYDGWFFGDSYTYNHDFATASLVLAMSAFESDNPYTENGDTNVQEFFDDIGFEKFTSYNYGAEDDDSVAIAMAVKEIDGTTVIAIALRGAGYGDGGWAGNVEVGDSIYHEDFATAAYDARTIIKEYISELEEAGYDSDGDSVKIWLTGYSRSAAVANLLSIYLRTDGIVEDENIYTYTFATPNNRSFENFSSYNSDYNNIFNIINQNDIVPTVPLSSWYFGKEGTTYYLPSTISGTTQTEYYDDVIATFDSIVSDKSITYETLTSSITLKSWIEYKLSYIMPTSSSYNLYFQNQLSNYFSTGDPSALDSIFMGVIDATEVIDRLESGSIVDYGVLVTKFLEIGISYYDTPLGKFANIVAGVINGYIEEGDDSTGTNHLLIESLLEIKDGGTESTILMEHWPEVYLSWMTTIDEGDLTQTNEFKYKSLMVSCPVDVSIYDESGNLVALIIDDVVQEIEGSTISVGVFGESDKVFVLPDDQEYSVEIIATDEGTMNYVVMENIDGAISRSVEFYDIELEIDQEFTGVINTEENTAVENYALVTNNTLIEADYDSAEETYYDTSVNMIGDVDGNGNVTLIDAMYIAQYINKILTEDDIDLSAADVNGDGKVTLVDAMYIAQYINGIITELG